MIEFDLIIAHYGTGRLTQLALRCLQTIREYSQNYKIIFVDNASPETDLIMPELEQHPYIKIRNPHNEGFIKATNQGLQMSSAPYVVLMNNDTEAVPNWLEKLKIPFLKYPEVGLTGPLTTARGSWQGKHQPKGHDIWIMPPGRMLAFFCTMIKREVIEKCGLLDETYGVGFGDDDAYCRTAERAGFKLALVQNLVIPHHHRSTFRTLYSTNHIADMQKRALAKFHSEA